MKTNRKLRPGFTLVELLVVIVIIASLAGLTAPMVMRQKKKGDQTEAINNARQIGLAFTEFDNEYGSFPDAATATEVENNNPDTNLTMGTTSSNDYFKQLMAANIASSESMFYAKTSSSKKPDNVFNSDAEALKGGEVGFAYLLKNDGTAFGTTGNSGRPTIMTPMVEGSTQEFDPDPFDSKLVVAKVDGSVVSLPISNKKAKLGANDFFAAGDDSVWGAGSSVPSVRAPLKK